MAATGSSEWVEVSKGEFYQRIGGLNVHPHLVGEYPYTSLFQTPLRRTMGKVVGVIPAGSALPVHRYYLPAGGQG